MYLGLSRISLLLWSMLCLVAPLAAATAQSDPLKKPALWSKLQQAPQDSTLWSAYVGKPWVCMNYEEKNNVGKWRGSLGGGAAQLAKQKAKPALQQKAPDVDPAFWDNTEDQKAIEVREKLSREKELADHFKKMEETVLQEPDFIVELKRNPTANFVIIEDTYKEEFEMLGAAYVEYTSKHPDGKYPKDKWLDEKANELRALKLRDFEKRKIKMLSKKG